VRKLRCVWLLPHGTPHPVRCCRKAEVKQVKKKAETVEFKCTSPAASIHISPTAHNAERGNLTACVGGRSQIGKAIHKTLFQKTKEKNTRAKCSLIPSSPAVHLLASGAGCGSLSFMPGRMAFEFDLDPEFPQELPTTITRSLSDMPRMDKKVLAKMPDSLEVRSDQCSRLPCNGPVAPRNAAPRCWPSPRC